MKDGFYKIKNLAHVFKITHLFDNVKQKIHKSLAFLELTAHAKSSTIEKTENERMDIP